MQVTNIFADRLAREFGIRVDPNDLIADGKRHRVTPDGDRPKSKALVYIIHDDATPVGWFEYHKTGDKGTFRLSERKDLSPAELDAKRREWAALKARKEAEQIAEYDRRAVYASELWRGATAVEAHPYLNAKGIDSASTIRAASVNLGDFLDDDSRDDAIDALLIPLYSSPGVIRSIQAITANGDKLFVAGAQVAGCYHAIAGTDKARILVCEGYATGWALWKATGHSVLCAMSAKNLAAVASIASKSGREVVICADNDHGTQEKRGFNPGLRDGIEAANTIGARCIWPIGCAGTDWDDYIREGHDVERLLRLVSGEIVQEPASEGTNGEGEDTERTGGLPATEETATVQQVSASRVRADLDSTVDPGDNMPARYSELNASLALANAIECNIRWVEKWGRWMIFDGTKWYADETRVAIERSKVFCTAIAEQARIDQTEFTNERQRIATIARYGELRTIRNVAELAKSDPRVAAHSDQWDADPWALNTPGGVVDLRTGRIRMPYRDDYMTRMTQAAPGGDCPTWKRFLDIATAGDVELQRYMQRVAGYCLTGSTREHAFFFVYGTGGNGKGTFINTFKAILGGYSQAASMSVFTEQKHDQHPTELACMMGARLVTAQETEEGKRWAEARIKTMTGGDPIRARFMRQDEFEFLPQFKLLFAGNHKPGLRNVDEAIKRRLHLIPFTVTVKPEDRDHRLSEKLQDEAAGILQWAIEGCIEWQRIGLSPPPAVLAATAEYLEQQDNLAAWIDECCVELPAVSGKRGALYRSYKARAEDAGEFALPQKRWIAAMEMRGFKSFIRDGYPMFAGIGVREAEF